MELSLSEARARLPELLDRAAAGETVHITRHGTPVATLVGHNSWMKTRTHDVLLQAQQIGRDLDAARTRPLPEKFGPHPDWDAEALVAEIRADRDVDVWDRIEAEREQNRSRD
jgi:prevent-host-death family protein